MREDKPVCMLCGSRQTDHLPPKYMHGSLWRCLGCGLHFVYPRPLPEEVEGVYDENYYCNPNSNEQGYSDYEGDRPKIHRTFKRRVKFLQALRPGKARVLDVGCAHGFFLDVAADAGWDVHGIDISRYAVERARERFGDRVQEGAFLDEELPLEAYDVITMWDYLEHILDPKADLAKARRLLVDGGILALATPDVSSLPAKIFGHRWMGYKVDEHLVYFSRYTIRRLLEEAGFRVISMKYEGKHVSMDLFLQRLCLYAPVITPLVNLLMKARAVAAISFYANPRDIILVIAQKSDNGAA